MNARQVVDLVVLSVGLEAGLIDERLYAVMVLATTVATSPLLHRIGRGTTRDPARSPLRRLRPHPARAD